MKFIKAVLAAMLLTGVLGCATLNQSSGEQLEKVKIGLDVVALNQDFSNALDALRLNSWTEAEERQIEFHIAGLQSLQDSLDVMTENGTLGVLSVLDPVGGKVFLEAVAVHFNAIRNLYKGYLVRENLIADPDLVRYSDSGVAVWRALYAQVTKGDGVRVGEFTSLLGYLARGYLMYRTGGISL